MPTVARTDSRDTAAEKFGVDRVRSGPEKAERDGIDVAITHTTMLAQGLMIIFPMENAAAITQRNGVRSPMSSDVEISKMTPKISR